MEQTSPAGILAITLTIVAGVLLALGHIVVSAILTACAIACLWAWINRDEDERGIS